ncbi:helix-turn-helix transcriptional regulator [Bradyrhizobium sp. WSM 1704]|uniref:helix-turn-helix transcriptional regulator n=1 Tax=Bradyrhizobium semiaridum TaxID=2821404 RepID=UPI001CE2BA9E|nr:helix-turn-helix transcriptional regulator [Bradyrhizobium semiaridum]MCA6124987.1 helix-turn-helix transcriptional regulator [Bradyrhizobium semiaridum]
MEDKLLDLIYGVVADPSRWPDVLIGVSDHLGAMGALMVHVPPPGSRHLPMHILARLPEEPFAVFREHYQWNPWTVAVSKVPPGKAVNANSLIEPGSIKKTAFWSDVCIAFDQADVLNLPHKSLSQDGGTGGIGFCLSTPAAADADKRVRELQRLAPHLCRALDASLIVASRANGPQQLAVILDMIPNAALLLDGAGRITQTNGAADALLRRSDGIAFEKGGGLQLVAALVGERRALARMLKDALNVANGRSTALSEPVQIARPSGAAPLLVTAVPLPRPAFAFAELVPSARVLVMIVDPAAKSRATASAIQAAYGLTGAEARVALLLASGITGAQMPAMLGVTAATIKTQLRRCFEKTGTHSQAELMRLFAMFPPSN